jgi:hypothetical protein
MGQSEEIELFFEQKSSWESVNLTAKARKRETGSLGVLVVRYFLTARTPGF